jgi:acyl-CoA dehydrogenase
MPGRYVKAFAQASWLGVTLPEEYGGSGLGVTEAALMLHDIAASGAGTSGCSPVHFHTFPPMSVLKHGTEALKRKYMPRVATGESVMAFGVTEPNAGTRHLAHPDPGRA